MCERCSQHDVDAYREVIDAHGDDDITDVSNSRIDWNRRSWPTHSTNVVRDMFELRRDLCEAGESEEVPGDYVSPEAARWPVPFIGYDLDLDDWPEWLKPILEREDNERLDASTPVFSSEEALVGAI